MAVRLWVLLVGLLAAAVALVSWRWVPGGVAATMPFVAYHADERPLAFYAHVGAAPLALLLLPVQLSAGLRARAPWLHRWTGRLYGLCVLVSGAGGLVLAAGTQAGPVAAMGFGTLALVWLGATAEGVALARIGRTARHRRWMIRSAALTFAAVTLRIWLPLSQAAGLPFDLAYPVIAWACWVPNLVLAELFIARRPRLA